MAKKETKKETSIICACFVFVFLICCSLFIGTKFPEIDYNLTLKTFHPDNVEYYQKDEVCQYEGCEEKADKRFYNLIFSSAAEKVLQFENKANFTVEADSFSYTPTKKKVSVEKGTYLVPQGDGSLKVEKRTYLNEYEIAGSKSITTTKVQISGFYCEKHAKIAEEIFKQEMRTVMIENNPLHRICVTILPIVFAVIGICVVAWMVKH